MRLQRLLIIFIIILSLIPVYYANIWLQKIIQPRRSFVQLMLYLLLGFALVFVYTFLLVALILRLFPPAKG